MHRFLLLNNFIYLFIIYVPVLSLLSFFFYSFTKVNTCFFIKKIKIIAAEFINLYKREFLQFLWWTFEDSLNAFNCKILRGWYSITGFARATWIELEKVAFPQLSQQRSFFKRVKFASERDFAKKMIQIRFVKDRECREYKSRLYYSVTFCFEVASLCWSF